MNGRKRLDWEYTALALAFNIANYRSEDNFVRCGCCIIKPDNSISLGYNGLPKKIENIDLNNREYRRPFMVHAEKNVLNNILYGEIKIIAVTGVSCCECIKEICSKGGKEIIWSEELDNYPTEKSIDFASKIGISLKRITKEDLRKNIENLI